MPVEQALIDEACTGLGVTEAAPLKDGGQKTVRLVERGSQRYVLKVIESGSTDPLALQRAAREVILLGTVDSEYVVKLASELLQLGDPPSGAAWLEEFLDGNDLADRLDGRWSWAEAAGMAWQVASGLGAMHKVRVVHRDLSPNNVRCMAEGRFKVMDPGFARHELLPRITLAGHPGTPGFMSPEHLRPPPAGPTAFSDVFCLGILMWTAVSGQPPIPFRGDMPDYANRLAEVKLEGWDEVESVLSDQAACFLARCLHRQPARRFKDGDDVADALRELL
jgi:serine/threonine-protein kinase